MTERVLHGLIQKAAQASDHLKKRLHIGSDGTIYFKPNPDEGFRTSGRIWDAELIEDLKVSQLTQEDH